MKKTCTIITGLLCANLYAQNTITFEEITLAPNSYVNDTLYQSNGITFSNYNDSSMGYFYWDGFALSNQTDTTTIGLSNQYSSFAGSGAFQSENYLIHYNTGAILLDNSSPVSFYVSNNTYAALDMKLGSAFSKKFGGATGNDPDYFKVNVIGYNAGTKADSTEFYLADFRFSDNAQDYILKDWLKVEINEEVDSIVFVYESSDMGAWGVNTPQYFCLDNFSRPNASLSNSNTLIAEIFPNPASDFIQINGVENTYLELINMNGQKVLNTYIQHSSFQLNTSYLKAGIYILNLKKNSLSKQVKIIIQK